MGSKRPLNVLLVGAGMYACGIGTEEFGTILPSLYEGYRTGLVQRIGIVGRSPGKRDDVLQKAKKLNHLTGLDVPVSFYPEGEDRNPTAYLDCAKTGQYDCAIVSVPDSLHFQVTKDLIRTGLHCLVVKPLVSRVHEADELIRLQREHNVYCAVEFHKRFDETNLRIRKMLREKRLGDLLYVLVEFSQKKSIPLEYFRSWSHETNIFQYLGVHYVDLISYFTGSVPTRAMALGQRRFLKAAGVEAYDAIQAVIEWKYGEFHTFTSTILTNWIDPYATSAMSDQKIKLVGTMGRIECDQKERGLKLITV